MRVEFNALKRPQSQHKLIFFQNVIIPVQKSSAAAEDRFSSLVSQLRKSFHALSGLISEKQLHMQSWIKMLIRVSWHEHQKLYNFIFF